MKYRQKPGIIQTIIEDESVIMHPDDGKVIVLNESGTCLWQLLQKWQACETIYEAFTAVYQTTAHNAQDEIMHFVTELANKGLLEVQDG